MIVKCLWGRMKRYIGILSICMFMIFSHPADLMAHASLIKSMPAPNSLTKTSPQQIVLEFNERLEDSLYYIKVINNKGQTVTSNKARLDQRHTTVTLELPKLSDGSYVTTYHIISADGHPIEGSYLFTIGTSLADNTVITNGSVQQGQSFSWEMPTKAWLLYISRVLYYLAFLTLIGWVMWSSVIRKTDENMHHILEKWRVGLLRFFVIALIFLVYFHYQELIGEGGTKELLHLFIETSIGFSWITSFILALSGFVVLQRKRWLDLLWVVLVIAAKCLNGHAMAFKPIGWTLFLDVIHITAAALWVGGLILGIVFWRNKTFLRDWLPTFSKTAFYAILVLTISGSITTWLFLPKLSYLLYSQWGTFLLIKVGFVLCVAIVGFMIRRYLHNRVLPMDHGERSMAIWLKVDLILMIAVVSIVGLLTYAAPLPPNQPLNWHEMGEKAHLSVNINPNIPGVNTFDVEIWLPVQSEKPKQVELLLQYKDDVSIAPISVPLQAIVETNQDLKADESFIGFKKYHFKSEGPYLSFAGRWVLELNIFDAKDEEISYNKELRVY